MRCYSLNLSQKNQVKMWCDKWSGFPEVLIRDTFSNEKLDQFEKSLQKK